MEYLSLPSTTSYDKMHNFMIKEVVKSFFLLQETVMNHLILDQVTEIILRERRTALQKEGLELAAYIKQNQDITHTLVNICQR